MTVQAQALEAMGVSITSTTLSRRYDGLGSDWDRSASHWTVRLYRANDLGSYSFDLSYSMGSAHTGQPKIEDVMHCCLSDMSMTEMYDNAQELADDLGMDTDTREGKQKAANVWKGCKRMKTVMMRMFSEKEIEELREIFEDF